jgi:hypothetical protein
VAGDSTINSVDDLMAAVGKATGKAATLFDTPPLSVADLRESTRAIREAVTTVDPTKALPQAEIQRLWNEMHEVAKQNDVGLVQVSGAMTLHAMNKLADVGRGTFRGVRLAGSLANRHILGHYAEALADIRQKGFYATVNEAATPYIEAVWNNFSSKRGTVTEDVLSGRLIGRAWRWLRRLVSRQAKEGTASAEVRRSGENASDSS